MNRYLKNLEETLNHNPESDDDLNYHRDLTQRFVEATNNSISNIRRIADVFRLDVEFDFQISILMFVSKLEIDMQFIKQGSNRFLPSDTGLMNELEDIINVIEEYLKKEKQ